MKNHQCSRAVVLQRTRAIALLAAMSAVAWPVVAAAATSRHYHAPRTASTYLDPRSSVPSRALLAALSRVGAKIPSFSRQTGLPCSVCHNQFPQLTPFGRLFKLNGYTMTGLTTINDGDSARPSLKLAPIPAVSAMIVTSLTHTGDAQPAAQNSSVMFPEQASVFLGGEVTPRVGAFVQFTYAAQDGGFGVDNIDVRYASHTSWLDKDLLFGATLHNNPTVQDVWNTVPAWGYPFMSSSIAPSSIAGTLIDGALAQEVLGLGGYALWDNLVYTEFTAYRSAQQGTHAPLDSAAQNVISGVIPYGRIALQHTAGPTYVMVGAFGFPRAHLFPKGITGPTDNYTTLGFDAQLERTLAPGRSMLIGRTSYIREAQHLDASAAAGAVQNNDVTLQTFRINLSYLPNTYLGGTLGYFNTNGSTDAVRFAPEELTGSRSGSPNTNGLIGELTLNAWQNARLCLQYVAYHDFNGASASYDVAGGRSASGNNTLYLYTWIAF